MRQRIPKSLLNKQQKLIIQLCSICGDQYEVVKSLAGNYVTCSNLCSSTRRKVNNKKVLLLCVTCSVEVKVSPCKVRKVNTCSNPCRMTYLNSLPRKLIPYEDRVKRISNKGYIRISTFDGKLVMEHRYIMEKMLGRVLTSSERVHHLNGIRTDNRVENLVLCATQADHLREWHPNLIHNLPNR